MQSASWPPEFEKLLKRHLPFADEAPIRAEERLSDLGLDSVATVRLMLELEDTFGVIFPEEVMNLETFSTSSRLWSVVSQLCEAAN